MKLIQTLSNICACSAFPPPSFSELKFPVDLPVFLLCRLNEKADGTDDDFVKASERIGEHLRQLILAFTGVRVQYCEVRRIAVKDRRTEELDDSLRAIGRDFIFRICKIPLQLA